MSKFSEKLKELRKKYRITRLMLAKLLYFTVSVVALCENGQRECGFDILLKLDEIFDTSTDHLIGKTDYKN